jgi:N-acetylglucosamine-6-sulfatase
VSAPAENIDLRPTFEQYAGATTPADVDGRSLKPLLGGGPAAGWRSAALVEHHGPDTDPADPDHPAAGSGNPTTYQAVRTADVTYVEYANGEKEFYDRSSDPDQLRNTVGQLPADRAAQLHATLAALTSCHGGQSCWDAAR